MTFTYHRDEVEEPVQNRWLALGCLLFVLVVAGGLIAGGVALFVNAPERPPPPPTDGVTASADELVAEFEGGRPPPRKGERLSVMRLLRPVLQYTVTLENVPPGAELPMVCEWVDPTGEVHRVEYTTAAIDRPAWPTHARYTINPRSPTGVWTVRMTLEGRVLRQTTFEVRGEPAPGKVK